MPTAEVLTARRPLVKKGASADWIEYLNPERLSQLLAAILLAEQAEIDWREEWMNGGVTAMEVVVQRLPALERESIKARGRTATREVAGILQPTPISA